jgi:hypothetical protein
VLIFSKRLTGRASAAMILQQPAMTLLWLKAVIAAKGDYESILSLISQVVV